MTSSSVLPVALRALDAPGQPTPSPELDELYHGFERELLVPLWTEIGDLMPTSPRPAAVAHRWELPALAARSGEHRPIWRVDGVGTPTRISLPVAELAEWLTGRLARTDLPELPRWL